MKAEEYFLNCHTEESISIRFKSLAKKWHPDKNKNPEATEVFQEINKQREKALRDMLKRQGKTEFQTDEFLAAYFSKDKNKTDSMIENLTESFVKKFEDSDKPPTFADAFKHVLGSFFPKTEGKNINSGDNSNNKQLNG